MLVVLLAAGIGLKSLSDDRTDWQSAAARLIPWSADASESNTPDKNLSSISQRSAAGLELAPGGTTTSTPPQRGQADFAAATTSPEPANSRRKVIPSPQPPSEPENGGDVPTSPVVAKADDAEPMPLSLEPAGAEVCTAATCGARRFGTAIDWQQDPDVAGTLAKEQDKLVFLIQISGNFEREEFT